MSNFILPWAVFEQHIIALGKTGSGKSSAMRLMIEHLLDKHEPVCIVDPKGDWWGLKASASGKQAGYPVVIFGGEKADVPLNSRSGGAVAELAATGNRPCIIDLGGWMPGARSEFWIDFASTFFRLSRGRRWLVIDEVHNFCPKGKIMDPQAGKVLHWSNRLASEGRGKGINLIAASQRPQKVHNDFLDSCETLIAMRMIHASSRGAVRDWIEGSADLEAGKVVLQSLAQMKRGEAWAWSPEAEFGPKQIKFPMFSTYDSFRPQNAASPVKLKGWADVDLSEVKKKLEAAVKEAEANDPKKLRLRIADLEKQLRVKTPQTKIVTDTTSLKRIEQLECAFVQMKNYTHAVMQVHDAVIDAHDKATAQITAVLKRFVAAKLKMPTLPAKITPAITKGSEQVVARTFFLNESHELPRPRTQRAVMTDVSPNGDLTGPERKILVALSRLRSIQKDAPSKEMVAAWAGYSPIGGAFGNPIGQLKSKGYVTYPQPGIVSLTTEGLAQIGEHASPTLEEVHQALLESLTGPERKILKALLDHGKEEISKNDLAAASGYAPVGGAFGNPIGALRTRGLLTYPRPGVVQAAEWLFAV